MWNWEDVDQECVQRLALEYPALWHYIISIQFTHSKGMMAYITYMAQRVIECHRILKDTGSIYYHCDPTASHYVKLLLDIIFGKKNFRNEIIWSYQGTANPKTHFKRKHDIILFYAKNAKAVFFDNLGSSEEISEFSKSKFTKADDNGKYKEIRHKDGSVHKQYMRNIQRCRDVWEMPIINAMAKERTGYPTQKPLALLERIIKASCPEGGLVLDPFCGCATTCVAAQNLSRKWIGIDTEEHAVKVLKGRLSYDDGLEDLANFIATNIIPQRTDVKIIEDTPQTRAEIKKKLFADQKGCCNGCEIELDIWHFEIDHIIPKSKGGGDYYENFQLLCGNCNRTKSNKSMDYLRNKIDRRNKELTEIFYKK